MQTWTRHSIVQFVFFVYVMVCAAARDYYPPWHLLITGALYIASSVAGLACAARSTRGRLVLAWSACLLAMALSTLIRGPARVALVLGAVVATPASLVLIAQRVERPPGYTRMLCVQQVSFLLPLGAGMMKLMPFAVVPRIALANIYVAGTLLWGSYIMIRQGHVAGWDDARPGFVMGIILDAVAVVWIVVANAVPDVRSLYAY